jgi:hypothetical protein
VLSVGLLAVATGFRFATSGVAIGGGETTAVFLAEQRIEQLRAHSMVDFAATALNAGTTTEYCGPGRLPIGTPNCQDTAASGAVYVRRTEITHVSGTVGCPASPLWCKGIRVRVSYNPVTSAGALDQPRAVDIVTVLGPRA